MAGAADGDRSPSSSSGEEDGDADWRAAIYSVASAAATFSCSTTEGGVPSAYNGAARNSAGGEIHQDEDSGYQHKSHDVKHYQIKAQKLLDDILEKSIEIVRDPTEDSNKDPMVMEDGVRLFKHAPSGIVFDHIDEFQQPRKRPRILRGEEINEKSKKFRQQIQSVAVDGTDVIALARDAHKISLAKLEAKHAVAKAAQEREAERVAQLKKVRGERWLPSVAREMRTNFRGSQ